VFGPAEQARNERLSKKLMELASQPKPPKSEMEVEQAKGTGTARAFTARFIHTDDFRAADPKDVEEDEKETGHAADGALSSSLSIPIPKSMLSTRNIQLLTPPPSPPCPCEDKVPSSTHNKEDRKIAQQQLFFHLLGVSTDISGFDANGELVLDFGT